MASKGVGLSVVEMLVALALAGIGFIAVVALASPLPTAARRVADALRSTRATAIADGTASHDFCASRVPLDSGVATQWPPRGLLFTPDGLPRTCDGGGVGNTTILLEHRGRQAAVIVSSLGRVRWELR